MGRRPARRHEDKTERTERHRRGACGNHGRSHHGGAKPAVTAGRLVAATAGRARLTPFGDQQELPTTVATTGGGLLTHLVVGNESVSGNPPLDRAFLLLC